MAALKAGDRVLLATREITPEDEKSGLYYSYFGGLTGTAASVYDDGTVCVDVDLDSLSAPARDRHLGMQEAERKKWLDGLSGEARNRLTPEQKQLKLSYKILASKNDVEPYKGDKPGAAKRAQKSAGATAEDAEPAGQKGPARAPEPEESTGQAPVDDESSSKRLSADDIAKAEEEHLRSLQPKS